ncbi:MAG: rhombotarget lipoprotein [Zetaproteobacteria bacterium]|nr:rhombotarget lipoprotein [Zetaproteobacteria bacterium]
MKKVIQSLTLLISLCFLSSCATGFLGGSYAKHESSSVIDYLYPEGDPKVPEITTYLNLPVRVGIAFTPVAEQGSSLPENEQLALLEKVRAVFENYPFIEHIEVIPSAYLRPKGGFDNLAQVGRMFQVEVMALVSYDQIQFDDPNKLSFLYWSIVGAYFVKGDQHDTRTMVDTSVFDIRSHKLLFRAPGMSVQKGNTTLLNYREEARQAQIEGYDQAVKSMIPNLKKELQTFKERVKKDKNIQVRHSSNYLGGGSFSWEFLLILMGLLYAARRLRSD